MARFGTSFAGVWGMWPRSGANLTTKPYTDELQILSSLCMPRHDFATAVKGATPDQLRDRVGCAYLIYTVQGVRAAGLQLAPLIYARIWNSGCINLTIFVVHTVSFVFIDVELTTPEGVHWQKSTRKWPVSGPVLQGRGASGPAQGQISQRNHTPINYKYCLVCACQGTTSPLQSKVPPQISCATGLGVPIWYTDRC